jgi:hypothetical protein
MKIRSKAVRFVSVLLFSVGILLGLALLASAAWGDFEASMFDLSLPSDGPLSTLRCPVLITASESGTVSATFDNRSERPIQRRIRIHVSDGLVTLLREEKSMLPLDPGEKQRLEWTVTADDAVWRSLILARVYQYRQYPSPSRTAACGILVVDAPFFTGSQILALVLVTTLLCIGIGGGLWVAANRPLAGRKQRLTYGMAFLAGTVLLGLFASLLGWWLLGGLCLILALLLAIALLTYSLLS